MLHACQHQNILFERSLASKLSNTPKMIFISHPQPLQISNKAKFHAFFEKFSHWKLNPAPTQDKFLDFLQNEFSHSKCFQKVFFSLEWECVPIRARASAKRLPPIQVKKAFWKHFEIENKFCKKSRNLSWVGAGFSFKWLNFSKKCMKFCFVWNLKRF